MRARLEEFGTPPNVGYPSITVRLKLVWLLKRAYVKIREIIDRDGHDSLARALRHSRMAQLHLDLLRSTSTDEIGRGPTVPPVSLSPSEAKEMIRASGFSEAEEMMSELETKAAMCWFPTGWSLDDPGRNPPPLALPWEPGDAVPWEPDPEMIRMEAARLLQHWEELQAGP